MWEYAVYNGDNYRILQKKRRFCRNDIFRAFF